MALLFGALSLVGLPPTREESRARDRSFAFLVYDLHYSYSDIMELPIAIYHEVFNIYDRARVKAEIAQMHAELRRKLKR